MAQLMDMAKGFVAEKISGVQKPEADLSDLSVQHVGRDGATLSGRLDVRNPYSHTIPICEISYSLKSAGRDVASGDHAGPGVAGGQRHHQPRHTGEGAVRLPDEPGEGRRQGLGPRLRDAHR
eukprot:UN09666